MKIPTGTAITSIRIAMAIKRIGSIIRAPPPPLIAAATFRFDRNAGAIVIKAFFERSW